MTDSNHVEEVFTEFQLTTNVRPSVRPPSVNYQNDPCPLPRGQGLSYDDVIFYDSYDISSEPVNYTYRWPVLGHR